jgi:hypothetical protein
MQTLHLHVHSAECLRCHLGPLNGGTHTEIRLARSSARLFFLRLHLRVRLRQ